MSEDEVIVGIDLGTTNSAVGVVDSGFPILLADGDGRRLVPSAIDFSGEEPVVGTRALRRLVLGGVVTSAKRLMGRGGAEGEVELADGQRIPAETAAAEVLRALKKIAEDRLGHPVGRAVITVPAYFNDSQRAATRRAGEAAGFRVERLLAEPTAAALSYGLDRLGEESRVAVYDLGGGTFDISILELREGVFEVLATAGETRLGGDDFDRELARLLLEAAGWGGGELSAEENLRLREEAVRVKHLLSDEEVVPFELPFFRGPVNLAGSVARSRFEEVLAPWLEQTRKLCRRALGDAGHSADDLDAVVLVGGSTRIPAVRELVRDTFGQDPDLSQHPDEAVALGAAIQAAILAGSYQQVLLLDVTPLSLGIETVGGLMNVLIPRNSTIPCKAGEMFTNAEAGQRSMRVRILQGERELARDNWELGSFDVPFEPAPRGQARVGIQFALDADGILEVLARDTTTGADTVLEITSAAVDVSDAEVERMVDESVEHAFADMAARVFAEARLKAEELLPAVEEALAQAGSFLSAEEKQGIDRARDEVTEAIQSGEGNRLKAAVEELDSLTEGVAARLLEDAMTKHWEQRLGNPEE